MKDEIAHLFRCIQTLLDSCSEHEILYDIFMSYADTTLYHTVLEELRGCINRISASKITREELLEIVRDVDFDCSHGLSGFIEPTDLIRFMGVPFTQNQQEMIRNACQEWATASSPYDPIKMAEILHTAIEPLTLADLLSPERTHMQRFPFVLILQDAGSRQTPPTGYEMVTNNRIHIPLIEDPAAFSGQLNMAIFLFLVQNDYIPKPCFPETLSCAVYDIGLLLVEGRSAIERVYGEGLTSTELFDVGRELFSTAGPLCDLRMIYRSVLTAGADLCTQSENDPVSLSWLELQGGHLLAGYLAACAEDLNCPIITSLIEIIRIIASRPAGRREPDTIQLQALSKTIQEMEQLIRAVTGNYKWRAVPIPPGRESYHPVIDLWYERNLLLYEPEDLVYTSRCGALALTMEALYRYRFIPPSEGGSIHDPWFDRLIGVALLPRAVSQGLSLHPGSSRWLEQFSREEYDPASRVVMRSRFNRLPPPDRYLYAVLFEGRTGADELDVSDVPVVDAIEATRAARKKIADPNLDYEECKLILLHQIWPVFKDLCHPQTAELVRGKTTLSGSGESAGTEIHPHGEAPQVDRSVPSPHRPLSPTTGKVVAGEGSDLLDDDGFAIPGGFPGARTGEMRESAAPSQNGGGGSPPSPGGGNTQADGARRIADELVEACERSREVIDDPTGDLSALQDLADTINDKVRSLESELLNQIESIQSVQEGFEEEWKGLLKISNDIKKAAKRYRDAIVEQEIDLSNPSGAGAGNSSSRTGMTRDALLALQKAGAEFQLLAGVSFSSVSDDWRARVSFEDLPDDPGTDTLKKSNQRQKLEPSFMAGAVDSEEFWENLAYYDAVYGDDTEAEGGISGGTSRDNAERQYRHAERALSSEAKQYLSTLRQRTQDDWETIEEKAERIRKVALFETLSVGEDDYSLYQRFYQPIAGLVGVARKNIQQAIQKNASSRDMNELLSGDDIDEENLAAVKTTMRIFKDSAREQDHTRWLISLLIDASSSMHDETVAKKLEATIRTAILFGDAVNRIEGITFEIAAFADAEYIPLKRYQDDWNIHQACYLIRQIIRATGGTNDVGALGSALDRMNRHRMASRSNRMVFILSDGQSGVGGREQLRQILSGNKEIRIFGWGVGPDMEEVEETYRPYGTWVSDIADLPRSIGEVLRRELGRPAMTGWKEHPVPHDDEEPAVKQEDV
ncbi:MAG: VWA domain-containing protein [Methanocalculus sp.]|uniref:vWA domain-containing protein n=1 Tax=Methanocalculus sp. TaxID=2004547 RepID=UPI002722BE22|nr:VWA domain-containing protein [Methanocalculus sp.]MDO9539952.1 VWA domain-containing protein [Methanocalculus sp.]